MAAGGHLGLNSFLKNDRFFQVLKVDILGYKNQSIVKNYTQNFQVWPKNHVWPKVTIFLL